MKVLTAIRNGDLDDKLDRIINAARDRQRLIKQMAADELEVGDEVRLVNLRPKYLTQWNGRITGRTVAKGRDAFVLDLIDAPPVFRRFKTQGITVPIECVVKLDA